MSLKHGLLGILKYKEMTGYELNKTFEDSLSFFWHAKASQIYRELNAMESSGWLQSRQIIQNDKPNKRIYTLTDAGNEELLRWMHDPTEDIEAAINPKSAFLMRIFFANELSAAQSLKMIRDFKQECVDYSQKMQAAYRAIAYYGGIYGDENAKYWKLTVLFGEEYLKATLRWADQAIKILEEENETQ